MSDSELADKLPKLPEGMFWRILPRYGYNSKRFSMGDSNVDDLPLVQLIEKRSWNGLVLKKSVDHVVSYAYLRNADGRVLRYYEVTEEKIIETCNAILELEARKNTANKLFGDYPPTSLED